MILPTGQIMFTDLSGLVEVYTPASGVIAGGDTHHPCVLHPLVQGLC